MHYALITALVINFIEVHVRLVQVIIVFNEDLGNVVMLSFVGIPHTEHDLKTSTWALAEDQVLLGGIGLDPINDLTGESNETILEVLHKNDNKNFRVDVTMAIETLVIASL